MLNIKPAAGTFAPIIHMYRLSAGVLCFVLYIFYTYLCPFKRINFHSFAGMGQKALCGPIELLKATKAKLEKKARF